MWLSLVERHVRDVEVAGSNPVISTKNNRIGFSLSDYFSSDFTDSVLSFALANDKVGNNKKTILLSNTRRPRFRILSPEIGFSLSDYFSSDFTDSVLSFALANDKSTARVFCRSFSLNPFSLYSTLQILRAGGCFPSALIFLCI